MRLAPAVSTTASNAGAWRWGQVLLMASAAGVAIGWALLRVGFTGTVAWIGVVAASAVAAAASWRLVPARATKLVWTGATWQVGLQHGTGLVDLRTVEVAMDLGPALLLRARPGYASADSVPRWLVVNRHEAGPDFRALCTALYAAVPVDRLAMPPEPPSAR